MTVYVDDAFIPASVGRHDAPWCHLMSDESVEELHELAQRAGLKKSWFQDHPSLPHYDVTQGMRRKAIAEGAKEISRMELARKMMRVRKEGEES